MVEISCTRCGCALPDYAFVAYDGPKEKGSTECSPFMEWVTLCEPCYIAAYPLPSQAGQVPE